MTSIGGKIALVTGGSRGLGLAIATTFAAHGIHVALGYRANADEAETHAGRLAKQFGVRAIAVGGDVSKSADVDRVVDNVEANLGEISILVNNAGVNPSGTIATLTEDDWNLSIAVNLTSAFLVTQRVLPAMRAAKFGRILMLSSVAAQLGGVIGPHYAASKAGMLGLMHSYAALLAKEGVTSNAIAPALIETDMIRDNPNIKPELLPVGRFGKPEEVADVALTLVRNGFITGQTFNVNGGWYHS
jgi:3-oxoacyl-[acyl-carrier protein] reductase